MEIDPVGRESASETPSLLYLDVYDDSLVRVRYAEGRVTLTRDDGRPMWDDGTNDLGHDRWEILIRSGYFVPIDQELPPEEAAKKLLKRMGEY